MSMLRPLRCVLVSCAALSFAGLAAAQETAITQNVYINCGSRFAAIFPTEPSVRDIAYTVMGRTVPARQFYVQKGESLYSVTIADFTNGGPAIDERIVEAAMTPIRRRGEVKFEYPEDYTPGIPGRQLNVFDANGLQHRASIYMNDYHLYITETHAPQSDVAAIQFEQSVLVMGPDGRDQNKVPNPQRYACESQPVVAKTAGDFVREAIQAEGGADALRALTALSVRGEARFWEPGQAQVAGGEPRFLGTANFEVTWDLANGMARTQWNRDQQYPFPAAKVAYTETVSPTRGFVTAGASSQPMSSLRLAAHLRELERASPRLLIDAVDNPARLRGVAHEMLGKRFYPTVAFQDGATEFLILFDPETRLPAAIRTRDDDNNFGDSNYDLVLDGWTSAGAAKVANSLSYRLNGIEVARMNYSAVAPNPSIAADVFAVPTLVRVVAKPPAKENVPYQWMLRRLFLNRLTDADSIVYPDGGGFKMVQLAPNVHHVQGGTANNLIVAMKDYLVVFDAPYGELQSRWTIEAAKAKYPGKPIKYLVLTHHHNDHTGGMRTYIAEGATLVVPVESAEWFEKTASLPHTIVPDALERNPKPVKVYGVFDNMTLKDETNELQILHLGSSGDGVQRPDNRHTAAMVFGYLPGSKLLYVTDLISPRGAPIPRGPETVALGRAMEEFDIVEKDLTIVGGHGTTIKRSEIEATLKQD
jgi:glyoxylase-like metal-dependent hydrolase (beta-lactamase superfamily II)